MVVLDALLECVFFLEQSQRFLDYRSEGPVIEKERAPRVIPRGNNGWRLPRWGARKNLQSSAHAHPDFDGSCMVAVTAHIGTPVPMEASCAVPSGAAFAVPEAAVSSGILCQLRSSQRAMVSATAHPSCWSFGASL